MSRVVCDALINGSMQPLSFTIVDGVEGWFLHNLYHDTVKYPGGAEGRPFYVWPTTPTGTIVAVDYSMAPVCAATPAATQSVAADFKANPTVQPTDTIGDHLVITYAP